MAPMEQWVRQEGSETLGPGLNPSLYLHFLTYITTENCDTAYPPPPLIHKFFDNGNFLKHKRVPLRNVSVLLDKLDKTIPTENREAPSFP